jgi:hypothetical protein
MTVYRILLAALAASVLVAVAPEAQGSGSQAITTCATTAMRNAVLTTDLLNCPGHGIIVGAPGITIDLQGFTISGDGGAGDGIVDELGYDRVTVKNGVVRGFDNGISAGNADRFSITNVASVNNTLWGMIVFGNDASIASSTASGNGQDGIGISGSSASIKSSTAVGNTFVDVFVGGDSGRITSVIASGSQYGISVDGDGVSVRSSTASWNSFNGIFVTGDKAKVSGNHADGNGYLGGAADGTGEGIHVQDYVTAPTGKNTARGNDDPDDCEPVSLC